MMFARNHLVATLDRNNAHQGYARRKAGTLKSVGYLFLGAA
jgi:hypothetical protein